MRDYSDEEEGFIPSYVEVKKNQTVKLAHIQEHR